MWKKIKYALLIIGLIILLIFLTTLDKISFNSKKYISNTFYRASFNNHIGVITADNSHEIILNDYYIYIENQNIYISVDSKLTIYDYANIYTEGSFLYVKVY